MLKEYDLPRIKPLDDEPWPAHFHDEVEVIFVLKGQGRVCCNGNYYEQPTGSILFVAPRVIHSFDNRSADFSAVCVFVNLKRLDGLISYSEELRPEHPVWVDPSMSHPAFGIAQSILQNRETFSDQSVVLLTGGILNEVLKLYTFGKGVGQNTSLEKVLNFCQEHYREPMSIKIVAAALSLSEGHISHLFTNRLHQSFPDYINALRTNEATWRMQDPNVSLSDISTACGFNSIRTFNRAFLKQFGTTPRQYRKLVMPSRHRETKGNADELLRN